MTSFLNPLFDVVAWVLTQIHAGVSVLFGASSGLTWVLSIVLLVVLMRLIMLPLFVKQVKSQQRMQAHMPQLRELQKRYKNDKQRQQEEMMKFYKENGINPLGGCLPLVAQLPVFWSLFNVLRGIAAWQPGKASPYGMPVSVVETARQARVFGATLADKVLFTDGVNVPLEHKVVIVLAVLISVVTTYLTMQQSQKRGMMQQPTPDPDNPAANMQKYMMYIAPLFALSGLYWQFGLVIYWVTTNVWTLGQQHFLFRNLPVVGANADSATAPATGAKTSTVNKVAGAARPGAASRSAASAKTGAAAKTGGAKTGTAVKPKSAPAGKNGANGSGAAAKETAGDTPSGTGMRNLLPFGKGKAEPEPEPAAQAKVVRQQPVRQTRSKRSGKR